MARTETLDGIYWMLTVVRGLSIDHDRCRGQLCTFTSPAHGTYLLGIICSDQLAHFSASGVIKP